MQTRDALTMARDILAEHGLDVAGWTVRLDQAKRRLGACKYDRQCISLSVHYVRGNGPDSVRTTILHEVAHALVGPGHGHGPAWRAAARTLGIAPERCGVAENMPEGRWSLRCDRCEQNLGRRHRRGKRGGRYRHVGCGGVVVWLDTGITSVVR